MENDLNKIKNSLVAIKDCIEKGNIKEINKVIEKGLSSVEKLLNLQTNDQKMKRIGELEVMLNALIIMIEAPIDGKIIEKAKLLLK